MPADALGFAQERTLWLPTVSGQPVASSPLVADPPQAEESPTAVVPASRGEPSDFERMIEDFSQSYPDVPHEEIKRLCEKP